MHRSTRFLVSSFLGTLGAAGLSACVGDDTSVAPAPVSDAGAHDATVDLDAGGPDAVALDGAAPDAPVEAGPFDAGGPFLLLTYGFASYSKSEYAAYDLSSAQARGGLAFAKFGTNVSTVASPWLLNQAGDVAFKMDAREPWKVAGAWSVAEPTGDAGGASYSDPFSVAETAAKAYVTLYNRNVVPVIDTTTDGGAPGKVIDLSGLVQAPDTDGHVETSAAVYDAARKRVWLVLSSIDLNNIDPQGYFAICTPGLTSRVVAIDTTTDALVPGLSYALTGVSPTSVAYDAKNDRLVVQSAGCNEPVTAVDGGDAGGTGPMHGRVIEALKLADGASTVLYDANAEFFPSGLLYVDDHRAFVSFSGPPRAWDPTTTTLGATVANAPDTFVWDGKGNLVGPRSVFLGDGGIGSIDVIAVSTADGGVIKIGSNPVTTPDPTGFWEGVDLWPRP